jgi:hypothetical protein
MNDLDLRTALHRDADLVGEPSPDLLDQLVRRRQHQRRQRAGMLTSALAVVVIAAGIPIGTSLLARSDGAPASETTVDDPTPSVSPEVVPTPAAVTPTPVVAPPTSVAPATSVPPAVDVAPACPDRATLAATLPADTADKEFSIPAEAGDPVCSGVWAAAGYSERTFLDGQWWGDGQAGLWRYGDGSWTFRYRTDCGGPQSLPAPVWERACNVD